MCYSLWYNAPTMLPAGHRPATSCVLYTTSCNTQSSLYYLFHYFVFRLAKQSQFIPLQNVVYFITLYFLVRKIFTFYINDVLLFQCPFPGSKG